MIKGNLTSEFIDSKLSFAVGTTSLDVTQAVSDAISKRAGTKNWQKINAEYVYTNEQPFPLEGRQLEKGEKVFAIAKSSKYLFFKCDTSAVIYKAPVSYFKEAQHNMVGAKPVKTSQATGDQTWWDQIANITTDVGKVIVAGAQADNAIKTGQSSQPITNYGAPQSQPTPPKKSSTALIVTPLILGSIGAGIGYMMKKDGKGTLIGAGVGIASGLLLGFVFRG